MMKALNSLAARIRALAPGFDVKVGEGFDAFVIKIDRRWGEEPDFRAALEATTQASRRDWVPPTGWIVPIVYVPHDPSHVRAEQLRHPRVIVRSARRLGEIDDDRLEMTVAVALRDISDAHADTLARLALAADPAGVARRKALAAYDARARLAELAAALAGTPHAEEGARIASEWDGVAPPEGRIKKLKRLARAVERQGS